MELGADANFTGTEGAGLDRTVREIDLQLRKYSDQNRHPVIVVDEAHLIEDHQVFQALRLLLNFQQGRKCRFSLIFVGQPRFSMTVWPVYSIRRFPETRVLVPLAWHPGPAGGSREVLQ